MRQWLSRFLRFSHRFSVITYSVCVLLQLQVNFKCIYCCSFSIFMNGCEQNRQISLSKNKLCRLQMKRLFKNYFSARQNIWPLLVPPLIENRMAVPLFQLYPIPTNVYNLRFIVFTLLVYGGSISIKRLKRLFQTYSTNYNQVFGPQEQVSSKV